MRKKFFNLLIEDTDVNGILISGFKKENKLVLFDLEDKDKIIQYRWLQGKCGPRTSCRDGKYLTMRKLLYDKQVYCKNGNKYDLRKENIIRTRPWQKPKKCLSEVVCVNNISWTTRIKIRGKNFSISFSIKIFGNEEAKQLALAARKVLSAIGEKAAYKRINQMRLFEKECLNQFIFNELRIIPKKTFKDTSIDLGMLANSYAKRQNIPENLVPHLIFMLKLGGGKIDYSYPNSRNIITPNLYEGNHEYENCFVEDPKVTVEI